MAAHGRSKTRKARPESHPRSWSAAVTKHSNALDLEEGVFIKKSPREIALSLKWSAEASKSRRGTPFRSAMSMLNFYMNRAGRSLSESRMHVLERAKTELRAAFGKIDSRVARSMSRVQR